MVNELFATGSQHSYVARRLQVGGAQLHEGDLPLDSGTVTVILAEPGSGKTRFLDAIARRHGTRTLQASIARHRTLGPDRLLVIDSLDEVARQGSGALVELLTKAIDARPECLVLASRSAEWDGAQTKLITELSGAEPRFAYLVSLDRNEQAEIFSGEFPLENFEAFLHEVGKIGLAGLLGNPMFLLLFAEAFMQGDRQLHSKAQTFQDAVERLAIEDPARATSHYRPPVREVLRAGSEIFAKLLLAGASGVATTERLDDEDFPYIASLSQQHDALQAVLDSRLFRPAAEIGRHAPVHRIIAEYCAARDLIRRIADPHSRVTLSRVLSLVAPNAVVRDDLRGLLGWLAALGSEATQTSIVDLDPYAVIANGDPGALTLQAKRHLLGALNGLADRDPYFRRADAWRRFNAAGFFTPDMTPEVEAILAGNGVHPAMVQLTLELILDEPIVASLVPALSLLVIDPNRGTDSRRLAAHCLKGIPAATQFSAIVSSLVAEDSLDGLKVLGDLLSDASLDVKSLVAFFRACQRHLDDEHEGLDAEYLTRRALSNVNCPAALGEALSIFAGTIRCDCAPTSVFGCRCREAPSRIVSMMLDRFFEIAEAPFDAALVWGWLRPLNFGAGSRPREGAAMGVLQADTTLRRQVQELCIADGASPGTNRLALLRHGLVHPGLLMSEADTRHLVALAFRTDNVTVWSAFIRPHARHGDARSIDALRNEMRSHARQKPAFMAAWSRLQLFWRRNSSHDLRWRRLTNRSARRRQARDDERIHMLNANRQRIEQGELLNWNQMFSYQYLHHPDKLLDRRLAEDALINGLSWLKQHTPSLEELGRGEKTEIAMMLHAGVLALFRRGLSLQPIDKDALLAVKTQARFSNEYEDRERELFEAALNEVVLSTSQDAEVFARRFIGASLEHLGPEQLWWLSADAAFNEVAGRLVVEWLSCSPDRSLQKLDPLFGLAVKFAPRDWLVRLVEERCDAELVARGEADTPINERAAFWFLRHFFFSAADRNGIWSLLLGDKMTVLALEQRTGAIHRNTHPAWPILDAEKAFRVLDAQTANWPAVPLPNHWGTHSPVAEKAYRFLHDLLWLIDRDHPDRSLPVIRRLQSDSRFQPFEEDLKSIYSGALRRRALELFRPPGLQNVTALFESGEIASVEDMRALLKDELGEFQRWLDGAETNPKEMFWPAGRRLDENTARNRIVDWLNARLGAIGQTIVIEHRMADSNRCDFTVTKAIGGDRLLLVCEVKGQWHSSLYTAAAEQLDALYAVHPDAAQQGIYLVLWFGRHERVAGKKSHEIEGAAALHRRIVASLDPESVGRLDVVVLDLEPRPARETDDPSASP